MVLVVILLVRMWVEKIIRLSSYSVLQSSSLWGCELKKLMTLQVCVVWEVILLVRMWVENYDALQFYYETEYVILLVRMWVEKPYNIGFIIGQMVILLVRMWVENLSSTAIVIPSSSSSLWGCELKRYVGGDNKNGESVILLVRMWVEKPSSFAVLTYLRHPPCEDVSWKENDVKMYGTQV